jgi:hypothetical protein
LLIDDFARHQRDRLRRLEQRRRITGAQALLEALAEDLDDIATWDWRVTPTLLPSRLLSRHRTGRQRRCAEPRSGP